MIPITPIKCLTCRLLRVGFPSIRVGLNPYPRNHTWLKRPAVKGGVADFDDWGPIGLLPLVVPCFLLNTTKFAGGHMYNMYVLLICVYIYIYTYVYTYTYVCFVSSKYVYCML